MAANNRSAPARLSSVCLFTERPWPLLGGQHRRVRRYAEGLNLTNHDNVLFYAWSFREQEDGLAPERITRTGVPGVPSVGLEIRF